MNKRLSYPIFRRSGKLMMSKIRFVYFDLGKVILNFSHQRMVDQVAAVSGLSAAEVQHSMFDNDLENRYEAGELNSQQFHSSFCDCASIDPKNCPLDEFLVACGDIFWLNAPTIPIISQLSQTDIGLGILSNTCPAHWDWAAAKFPILEQFFPIVVTSYDAKSMKPEKKIYQTAIDRTGLQPDQIFFVDDRAENVQGAKAASIDAVLFTDANRLVKDLLDRGICAA